MALTQGSTNNPRRLSAYADFFCGWGAGCVETCILFPSSKIIFRQQLHGFHIRDAIGQIRAEGPMLLYRGLLPPLIMRTSSRAIMFGLYDKFQTALGCPHSPPGTSFTLCHATAAMLAGCCEAALVPLERVQVLLQTSSFHDDFRNTAQAFRAVVVHGVPEFYRGLSVVLVRNSLSNALFFTLRHPFREQILAYSHHSEGSSTAWQHFAADFASGAVLGACISTLFFPLNVVKNHMMSRLGTGFERPWHVFADVLAERNYSLTELYRGVHLNFTRSLIAWGITNAVYEILKRQFFEP